MILDFADSHADGSTLNAAHCSVLHRSRRGIGEIQVTSKHRVTINISGQEYSELSALSDRHRVSLAWLGRQAIIEFLDRCDKVELQLPLNLSSGQSGSSN